MHTQDSHNSCFKLAFQRENGGFLVGEKKKESFFLGKQLKIQHNEEYATVHM